MKRKATEADIIRISEIYESVHDEEEAARSFVGWVRGVYPTRQTAESGVAAGEMYVEEDGGIIVAAARINKTQGEEYRQCSWQYECGDDEAMVIHTLVVDPKFKGKGYGSGFVRFYEKLARDCGARALRIDTQEKNLSARALYGRLGFSEAGIISCCFNGIPDVKLVCLEKKL